MQPAPLKRINKTGSESLFARKSSPLVNEVGVAVAREFNFTHDSIIYGSRKTKQIYTIHTAQVTSKLTTYQRKKTLTSNAKMNKFLTYVLALTYIIPPSSHHYYSVAVLVVSSILCRDNITYKSNPKIC